MKFIIRKNIWVILADIIFLVFACFSFYAVTQKAVLPIHTDISTSEDDRSSAIFESDTILSINGSEVNENNSVELLLDMYVAGDIVNVQLLRDNNTIDVDIQTIHYYNTLYFIVLLITGLAFLLSSAFVLIKIEDRIIAQVFHLCLFSAFVMLFYTWGSLKALGSGLNIIIRIAYDISLIIVSVSLLHFSFVFPKVKSQKVSLYFKIIYAIIGLAALPIAYINYSYITSPNPEISSAYFYINESILKSVIAPCFMITVINYFHSYIIYKDYASRGKLLWIFLGLLPGPALYVFFYRLTAILFGEAMMSETSMIAILILTPISLMIATVRYQLFDVRTIYRRSIVYGSVLALLALLYVGMIYLFSKVIQQEFEHLIGIPNAIAALVNVLLFHPIKTWVQNFVDKKFFKVKYDHKEVEHDFLKEIKKSYSQEDINRLVEDTISKIMPVDNYYFFVYSEESDDLKIVNSTKRMINQDDLYRIKEICKKNYSKKLPIASPEALDGDIEYIEDVWIKEMIHGELTLTSFTEQGRLINALSLGKKLSGFRYRDNDISILRIFAFESGNAIQRIELQKKLLFHKEETKRLEEISSMKSFFVSSVSHELKTPLTSIRMFAELISVQANLDDNKKTEYLNIIQGECGRLNRLVDNVLDFSKIERGSKEYIFSDVDLNGLIESVITMLRYRLDMLKFDFDYELSDAELIISADKDSVSEVIINLISNSMKYTGDVKHIRIKSFPTGKDACFEIRDKGIGIPKDEQKNIFEPFYRSKYYKAKVRSGAGIGLSLVNNIVTSHKGRIELESEEGKGSAFRIYFPKVKI